MWPVLHIDGRALDGNAEALRKLLLGHTGCERSASEILLELAAARRSGPVQHVVILPAAPRMECEYGDERTWQVRVTYATPDSPADVPPDARPDGRAGEIASEWRIGGDAVMFLRGDVVS